MSLGQTSPHPFARRRIKDEALLVVDEFMVTAKDLQEGPGMRSDDVDYMVAKVQQEEQDNASAVALFDRSNATLLGFSTAIPCVSLLPFPVADVQHRRWHSDRKK